MKISVTNERELKSAKNHLHQARERLRTIKSKTEKRNQYSKKLDELYTLVWKANDEILKLSDEVQITIGGV